MPSTILPSILSASLLALLLSSGPVRAALFSDEEPDNWVEGEYVMPPAPRDGSLRAIALNASSGNRYLLDERSLSAGSDGVVRYVLVVRTSGGAENVTFEGLRCAAGAWRLYAMGRSGGEWATARETSWRALDNNSYDRVRPTLARDYFCDGVTLRGRDEIVRRLSGKDGFY